MSTSMSRAAPVMALLIMFSLLMLSTVSGAVADEGVNWVVETQDSRLPTPMYRSSLAWTGEKAYVFSGTDGTAQLPHIVEFDPGRRNVVLREAELPSGRIMSSAAWVEPYAYIFGGQHMGEILDEILRYDPVTDVVETLPVRLPEERMGTSAVAVNGDIFVVGGRNVTGHVNTIFRFSPGEGTIEEYARLPATGGGRVVVWDGERMLLFGGCGANCALGDIYEFDLETRSSHQLSLTLPSDVYWTSGVWTGESALIFGGNDWAKSLDEIVIYTPGEGDGTVEVAGHLPTPLELTVSFWDGKKAYVLGGVSGLDGSDRIHAVYSGGIDGEDTSTPGMTAVLVIASAAAAIVIFSRKRR